MGKAGRLMGARRKVGRKHPDYEGPITPPITLLHVDKTCIKVMLHGRKLYMPHIRWRPLRKRFTTRTAAEKYRLKVLARM